MQKYKMKSRNINEKGFSLVEVVVALFILSISVITIYNLIISTSVSTFQLEQKYLAKEVASNRIALIHTIEKPLKPINRNGGTSIFFSLNFSEIKTDVNGVANILHFSFGHI